LRPPKYPDTWYRFDGPSFIIRASDVIAEDRGSVPPTWAVRLEALGMLDSVGLKLWVEVGLASLTFFQKAKCTFLETSVTEGAPVGGRVASE
jgi:hypothetical protein